MGVVIIYSCEFISIPKYPDTWCSRLMLYTDIPVTYIAPRGGVYLIQSTTGVRYTTKTLTEI